MKNGIYCEQCNYQFNHNDNPYLGLAYPDKQEGYLDEKEFNNLADRYRYRYNKCSVCCNYKKK